MGFFNRKKARNTAPDPVPVPRPVKPGSCVNAGAQYHVSPPPPQVSQYATSTTQTPTYWHTQPQQPGQHQPPPSPYYHQPPPPPPPPPPPQQQQQLQIQHHHPQGWSQYPQRGQYATPIVVNQHHYNLAAPTSTALVPSLPPPAANTNPYSSSRNAATCPSGLDRFAGSMVTLARDFASPRFLEEPNFHPHATQLINSTAACVDQIAGCFNDVVTLIDRERLVGNEKALFSYQSGGDKTVSHSPPSGPGGGDGRRGARERERDRKASGGDARRKSSSSRDKGHSLASSSSKVQTTAVTASVVSGNYFAKVELYANSRLPLNLPPLRLYMPTWPLLCLAAQYAERVYEQPRGAERDAHVSADWKTGTKAMVIKSVPMDHMDTIVFAIRGSATFMDWAVNLNAAPASPAGFLDDEGNSCHAGFLAVARKMVGPVAARLRQLLEEDPGRSAYSLLITGHSAGGAVASLLYAHMLAESRRAASELNTLTARFKRVHCVTFGTPPVSLLPLRRPERPELRKSLFLTFVNEGDPVTRADKAYVRSLLELFASPAPPGQSGQTGPATVAAAGPKDREKKKKKKEKNKGEEEAGARGRRLAARASGMSLRPREGRVKDPPTTTGSGRDDMKGKPIWRLPPSTLSSPGRIVVLRSGDPRARLKDRKTVGERLDEGVVAQTVSDEELRGVVWGDPVCHVMRLYSGRIETLAVGAVTGRHG
ncbi:Putative fungal lipase-like domain, alpha/Beta hydrolase [Colletotrichum destructivum]|uniref:Fungal lipase-like domain, alpha/Beta hydrolase n=1 Tax=Colletotrichum destructivum TaxID=34406 RepID=A0AAX4J2Y4_9PEZI|nr:Putative fungal lipase-like domain, alpha/Beta hydrolase [Colletotrichum destructivum]